MKNMINNIDEYNKFLFDFFYKKIDKHKQKIKYEYNIKYELSEDGRFSIYSKSPLYNFKKTSMVFHIKKSLLNISVSAEVKILKKHKLITKEFIIYQKNIFQNDIYKKNIIDVYNLSKNNYNKIDTVINKNDFYKKVK